MKLLSNKKIKYLLLILLILLIIIVLIKFTILDGFTKSNIKIGTDIKVSNNLHPNELVININLSNKITQNDVNSLKKSIANYINAKVRSGHRLVKNKIIKAIYISNSCISKCPELDFETKGKKNKVTGLLLIGDNNLSIASKLNSYLSP